MNSLSLVTVVVFITSAFRDVGSFKILCAYPTISPSHFLVVGGLARGLAEHGHNVTVFTSFPSKTTLKNYRQIYVPVTSQSFISHFIKNTGSVLDLYTNMPVFMDLYVSCQESVLLDPNVKKIMQDETFDLVIVEGMFGYGLLGLGAHFKCPTVTFVSLDPALPIYAEIGNPLALSYISHPILGFSHPLSFRSKVLSMLLYAVDAIVCSRISNVKQRNFYKKYFPSPAFPTYDDMRKNVSINFFATHLSEGNIRPLVPSTVQISGIHINDKAFPLEDGLQKWMDDSINGVIYFSLGLNMKSALLSEKQLIEILHAFGRLKENVLWKFENDNLPFLPQNVRIEKRLPQNDLLQHRNIKLFITHGGLGSITEAKFHGVPLIITPLFADQMSNAQKVVDRGWGIQFPFAEMSEEILTKSIKIILSDPKYSNQAKYESMLYRDRPNTPLETGVYWIEYVIRHHGAKQLKSNSIDLNFFQFHSLDVIGFLAIVILLIVLSFFKLISIICRTLRKNLNKVKSE